MSVYLDYLKRSGAPADVIAEAEQAERERMMQRDYTQKTQQIAERERQLSFLAGQLQAQQGVQAGPQRKVDEALARLGDDESGAALRKVLGPVLQAVYEDVDSRYGRETQQLKQALGLVVQQGELSGKLREALVPKYGDKINDVLPKIEQVARQALYNGQSVNPEQILWDVAADVAARARVEKDEQEARARQRNTLAGFEQVHRTSPPGSGGSQPLQQGVGVPTGPGVPAKPAFDPAAMYLDIREEIDAGRGAASGAR